MAVIELQGNVADITGKPVERGTTLSVKASRATPTASGLTVTEPENVPIGTDGSITVRAIEGVKGWLYIEHDGWSDSVPFIAASGMTKLWEAILNGAGLSSSVGEYLDVKGGMKKLLDEALRNAKSWDKGRASSHPVDSPPDGVMRLADSSDCTYLGIPSTGQGFVTTVSWGNPGYENRLQVAEVVDAGVLKSFRRYQYRGQWQPWKQQAGWDRGKTRDFPAQSPPDGVMRLTDNPDGAHIGLPSTGQGFVQTISWGNPGYEVRLQVAEVVDAGVFKTFRRYFYRGKWQPWRVQASWDQGRVTAHPVESPPDGVMRLTVNADCEYLGLPTKGQGYVTTVTWGNPGYEVRLQVAEIIDAGVFKTFRRYFYGGKWQGWTDQVAKSTSSTSTPAASGSGGRDGAPSAGLKTVPVALSLGNLPGNTRPATGSYRNKFLFNAPIFRWRVCMSARNPRFGTTNGADVKVTRVTFGEHAGGGKFKARPRTIATDLVLGRDGSVAKSDWQTGGIAKNREFLLGYDYTGTAETFGLVGSSWKTTTGTAADIAPTLGADWLTPLDIWLEVETYAGTPVVAAFGDSLTCGVGDTWSVFDSWLSKYCRDNEALPVHYAASGDNARSWASDFEQYKWTRWDEHATPDAIIYALGSNDIASSTLDEIKQHTLAVVGEIQRKWNTAVYAANFTPRNTWINQPGDEVRKQYNQWLATQPWARQVFDFSTVVRDTVTGGIKDSYNGDNVHLNTAGYAAEAAAIKPLVTGAPVLEKAVGEVTMADLQPVIDAVNNRPNGWFVDAPGEVAGVDSKAKIGDYIYVAATGEIHRKVS